MKKMIMILLTLVLCGLIFVSCQRDNPIASNEDNESIIMKNDDDDQSIAEPDIQTPQNTPSEETTEKPADLGNIKIKADVLRVRESRNENSRVLGNVMQHAVYKLLNEGTDDQGRVWYQIEAGFGLTGWIAGWYCEKTDSPETLPVKSPAGELLFRSTNQELLIEMLLAEDYSLEALIKKYGSDYKKGGYYAYTAYQYKNGLKLIVNDDNQVVSFIIGEEEIHIDSIQKKTCDIFEQQGDEILILFDHQLTSNLLVIDASSKKVLRHYDTGYLWIEAFETGNFLNEGKQELYLSGTRDGYEDKNIFRVENDDFLMVYDGKGFNLYQDSIIASIANQVLKLDITIGAYSAHEEQKLPDRIFWNTQKTEDKNKLLSVDPSWTLVQAEGKWYVKLRYTVNIIMLTYYWGPPDFDVEDNSTMYNDLARVDILLELEGPNVRLHKVSHEAKYKDGTLLNKDPIAYDEGMLVNGPALGMSMEEAYKALGGDINSVGYSDNMSLNGVSLFEFCAEIVDIMVETDKYTTTRGLKVGDGIEQVESLYGKPDIGFSGDDRVEYKFIYIDLEDHMRVNFYRSLAICYENGRVKSFTLSQVILD